MNRSGRDPDKCRPRGDDRNRTGATFRSLLTVAILAALALPAAASATWAEHCKVYTRPHCYSLFTWGPPHNWNTENFAGVAASFNVASANTTGVRMQDEMWVSWPEAWPTSWGWIETGLTIGIEDCCTPYRFVAFKTPRAPGATGYYEWDDWQHPQPMGVNINFTIQQEAGQHWGVWWTNTPGGYDWTRIANYGGFPKGLEEVELGFEAATFAAPENEAYSTLGLIDSYPTPHYVQAPWGEGCISPNVGLWYDYPHGRYGSIGPEAFPSSPVQAGGSAPPVFGESMPTGPAPRTAVTTTTAKRKTKAYSGRITSKQQTSPTTTVYHGKIKLAAPARKGETPPTGDTMVEVRDAAGRVTQRYVGEGEPNPELMQRLWEG